MALNLVAKAALTVAMTAANMAVTASQQIEGPRLDNLKFTGGDYGAELPLIWGKRRMDAQVFWAEELREIKQQRKTKGGKFNEYTYYGTWAVALAGHEISGISRIWFDTHLVLDLTGEGPITPFELGADAVGGKGGPLDFVGGIGGVILGNQGAREAGGFVLGDGFVLYKGTETQDADPRMQATVEAQFGEGSCPAYRGTAYIVFKDVPLEKLGNRIPQVSVELISDAVPNYPYQIVNTGLTGFTRNPALSSDFSKLVVFGDNRGEVWDLAARALMIEFEWAVEPYPQDKPGFWADGSLWFVNVSQDKIISYNGDFGGGGTEVFTFAVIQQDIRVIMDGNGDEHWFSIASSIGPDVYVNGTLRDLGAETGYAGLNVRSYFADYFGNIWAAGDYNDTTAIFYKIIDIGTGDYPNIIEAPSLADISGGGGSGDSGIVEAGHFANGTDSHFILKWGDVAIYAIRSDGTIAATGAGDSEKIWLLNLVPGSSTAWRDNVEISLLDLTAARTVTTNDWVAGYTGSQFLYDPINHALLFTSYVTQVQTWLYLDRVGSDGVPLSVIAGDIADLCGVADYGFTALDQIVQGWSATRGQGSNMLGPLLDTFDSDIRPHGFTMQGIKRDGVSGGTILTERFAKSDPRYTVNIKQAAELPRSLTVNFADIDADQQPNNARADRPLDATGARADQTIDLGTLATDVSEARDLADRYFRRLWNSRKEVSLSLTAQQLALEPGDCRILDLDGETDIYRVVSMNVRADGLIATTWKYDHPSLAVLAGGSGAGFDGRTPSVVAVPLISKGFVLDIPLLTDSHNSVNPLLYVAAGPYATGVWPGATVFQAISGEYSDEFATINSTAQATWGYATDILADANPWIWDRANSVNVLLQVGTLTGCTEADIDAQPTRNLCLIGDEIVNFTTSTLEGDGSYTLSGFKRGRRGTEWACGVHAARDVFLLLNTAQGVAAGLSEVGTNLSFKAITQGRTESGAFQIPLSLTGATLKPYAPVHLDALQVSTDWELSWVRRTRVGGSWTSGTSIPLSEVTEEYELEIMNGATVVRTVTGLTTPEYTYSAANQTTDFGAPLTSAPDWRVYQISDAVDRGFVAAY